MLKQAEFERKGNVIIDLDKANDDPSRATAHTRQCRVNVANHGQEPKYVMKDVASINAAKRASRALQTYGLGCGQVRVA